MLCSQVFQALFQIRFVGKHTAKKIAGLPQPFLQVEDVELGGMYNAQWSNNIFQFTPVAGIWLYADQTNTISLTGGYLIPSDQFETLRGWRAGVGGTFSLW